MDYHRDFELAKQFLAEHQDVDETGASFPKYKQILTDIANRDAVHLLIEVADIEMFNHELANKIAQNTNRYVSIFYEALDEILPLYKTKDLDEENQDPMDVFIEQRLKNIERHEAQAPTQTASTATNSGTDIDGKYPPELIRRAEISFKPSTLTAVPVREVKADKIGNLITVRGIVTRCTDVKPKIKIVTYTCDQCGCETFQPVSGNDFTPISECTSLPCKSNKSLGRIFMQTRGSKFVKYQEIKLQEHSDQVPMGNIPRSITVMAHGELTRLCSPGDHVSISGVFLPMDKSTYMFRHAGLSVDTYIDAHYICQMNKTEDDELNNEAMTYEEALGLLSGDNFLSKLSSSIAPEIFGHENLKKALLLLLVGGVDQSPYGMKIRGNINICLMGDPGVAKSQLLSFIDRLAARSQYTTGRGSSGVGLTAAVLKDPITNELVLEGGALVLADQGICCIDEFDKMMEADRTAIHEVMEQQTVSIAKAGIMTTLNARVSILAAANPAFGRYNVHKTITDNLQLPPALLSRFDLLWLIKDVPNMQKDLDLASHVTQIHKCQQIEQDYDAIDMKVMRRYIALCKTKNPIVPEYLTEKFVNVYLNIRARKRISSSEDALFTSARSLLAVLRLTTAFARLRLSDVVEEADLDAAISLYNCSRESIGGPIGSNADTSAQTIMKIISKLIEKNEYQDVPVDDIMNEAVELNLNEDQVRSALEILSQYESIDYRDNYVTKIDN